MEERPLGQPSKNSAERQWQCVTCGEQAAGDFCSHCGEKRRRGHDLSLRHILGEAVEAFFHVDSKVFLTLKTLFSRPGKLSQEFFLGRRKPYMSPLQTFFVCNLLFFVLQPLTGLEILAPPMRAFESNTLLRPVATHLIDQRLAKEHISRNDSEKFSDFTARFDRLSHLQAKSLILVLCPMMAVVLAILNIGRNRYFSEHVVFSVHAYAWWLLWLLMMLIVFSARILVSRLAGHTMNLHHVDLYATLLEFGGLGLYIFLAARGFYQDGPVIGLVKGIILTFCGYGLFLLYRALLLFTVVYSV